MRGCSPGRSESLLDAGLPGGELGEPRLETRHRELLFEVQVEQALFLALQSARRKRAGCHR
jgi:hypothetical protein